MHHDAGNDPDARIPVPRQFFEELLPAMRDIAEIKVMLTLYRLLASPDWRDGVVPESALYTDEHLLEGLRLTGAALLPLDDIRRGIELAVARGALLRFRVVGDDGGEAWLMPATPENRLRLGLLEQGLAPLPSVVGAREPAVRVERERPNVFRLYEQNVGLVTPIIADQLIEALELYPEQWIEDAIQEAVSYNRRQWRYIQRILERWATEGRGDEADRRSGRPAQLSTRRGTSAANMPPSSDDHDSCPICKGAGFLRVDAPVGSPNFGRLIPCECKIAEREERRHREIAEMSSLGAFEGQTFETFDPDVPGVREAYEAALAYAENPDGWLFLLGGYGCGKTHLAAAVAHYVIAHQRMRALFLVVPDLLDHLRATFAPDQGATYDARFNAIRTIDLLVLDDLGTEHTTPWAREKLFQIINFRYNERRPTIITSNRNFDELDPRVASRLSDPRICHAVLIPAGDYRVRRASALRRFPGR